MNIVLYEKNRLMSDRLRTLLSSGGNILREAESAEEILSILKERGDEPCLVLADVDSERDGGVPLLEKICLQGAKVPLIVLATNGMRPFLIRLIQAGATDIILKPFEDKAFTSKMNPYLAVCKSDAAELVTLSIRQYLGGELRKAQKGKYPLTVMLSAYLLREGMTTTEESTDVNQYVYENIRPLFWDTDIFIRFGSKYYMGVFPFCGSTNAGIIDKKMHVKFQGMKMSFNRLARYDLSNVFISYPEDAADFASLGRILTERARENIGGDIKLVL